MRLRRGTGARRISLNGSSRAVECDAGGLQRTGLRAGSEWLFFAARPATCHGRRSPRKTLPSRGRGRARSRKRGFAHQHQRPGRFRLAPNFPELIFWHLPQRTIDTPLLIYKNPICKGEPYDWTGNHPRHGYELARRIEQQTKGALRFTLAALYPMLYRMEQRGWIRGSWETSQQGRRRRCYRLTAAGKTKLSPLRKEWSELFSALRRLTKVSHA